VLLPVLIVLGLIAGVAPAALAGPAPVGSPSPSLWVKATVPENGCRSSTGCCGHRATTRASSRRDSCHDATTTGGPVGARPPAQRPPSLRRRRLMVPFEIPSKLTHVNNQR
jgi:hypothetical protein